MKETNEKKKKSEHSPGPEPERAIYGFFMLVASLILFILYVVLSFFPEWLQNQLGLTYLPDRYWSIALPAYIVIIILSVVPFYISLNMTQVNELDSIYSIKDEYTLCKKSEIIVNSKHSIDPAYDIPISDICSFLYKDHAK